MQKPEEKILKSDKNWKKMHHCAVKRTPNMYVHTAIYFGKFDLIRDRTQAARKARGCIIFTPKIILLTLGKILSASSSW